jgi:hypothetical protein
MTATRTIQLIDVTIIAEILVGHGEGVQYDQVLFVIEPA